MPNYTTYDIYVFIIHVYHIKYLGGAGASRLDVCYTIVCLIINGIPEIKNSQFRALHQINHILVGRAKQLFQDLCKPIYILENFISLRFSKHGITDKEKVLFIKA